jgi:UDP-N-acetylmuramyl pentapeptide phosphotransferase/UDP-N-acetylglucosamine-1-phosphate transferase
MEQIIIGGIISFLITFYVIPVIINVANAKKLYDEPDSQRKLHQNPIPSLGGLGMFVGLSLCLMLTIDFWNGAGEFQFYMATFLIIFFVGIKDDIVTLSAAKKFAAQLAVAAILMVKSNLLISNVHGFLGLHQIETTFSFFLTTFAIVVIINAFNLIDGVDGLAASVGLVTTLIFGSFFLVNGNIPYAVLGFGMAGSLLAFLIYNFYPAKIFMGDTGSLLIGLVNSVLVIKFIETASGYSHFPVKSSPAVGFGIMLLPLMDTLRVFGIRILHGRSPFSPDRNHLHHILLDRGLGHRSVALISVGITGFFAVLAFLLQGLGTTWLIATLIGAFYTGVGILHLTRTKVRMRVVKGEIEDDLVETSNRRIRLVSLFNRGAVTVDDD